MDIWIYLLMAGPYALMILIEILAYAKQYQITTERYRRRKLRLRLIQAGVNLVHSCARLFYYNKVYVWLNWRFFGSPIWSSIFLLVGLSLEKTLINLPFNFYAYCLIRSQEKRHILRSFSQFLLIKGKTWLHRAVVLFPLSVCLLFLQRYVYFVWPYIWGSLLLESILVHISYRVSWFTRLVSLSNQRADPHLVQCVFAMADRFRFPRSRLCLEPQQDRCVVTFQGKYLVISDSAFKTLSSEEIETLMYIELTRWKRNYHVKRYIMRMLFNGVWLFLLNACVRWQPLYAGLDLRHRHILAYFALRHIFTPISFGYDVFERWVARRSLSAADRSAVSAGHNVERTLMLVSSQNQVDREHDRLYELIHCRKPSLNARLLHISDKTKKSA